jgi:hypothetical protein
MAIHIDKTKLENSDDYAAACAIPMPEYQVAESQIGVMGISFPSITLSKRAMTTGILTYGSTFGESGVAESLQLNVILIFPAREEGSENLSPAERYAQLRKWIVESGLPLLDDEELRQEIRERKGVRTELEA